jgi:lysylphosphatidylglycerol synthetase-like protein (DUF2156 family)
MTHAHPPGPSEASADTAGDAHARHRARVLRFGRHAQAWATLQPGVEIVDLGHGSVACRRAWGVPVVLGDPVCAPPHRDAVVDAVVDALPGALFFQTGDDGARRLHEHHGWYATPLGVQPLVDVPGFSLRGRHKQALRSALNRAARAGLCIGEVDPDGHLARGGVGAALAGRDLPRPRDRPRHPRGRQIGRAHV